MSTSSEDRGEGTGDPQREAISQPSSEWPESFATFQSLRTRFFDRMFTDALLWAIEIDAGGLHRQPEQHGAAPIVESGCEEGY